MAAAASFAPVEPIAPVFTWGIYTQTGNKVFVVDSFLDMKYSHDSKVSDFPVELGAFTSYNKVLEPAKAKVRLAVGGQSAMNNFMIALEDEVAAPNLYNIFTQEKIYFGMTLEKVSYPREQAKGANMIVADLELVEIRQVAPSYAVIKAPQKPKSTSRVNTGLVQPGFSGSENVSAHSAYSSETTQQKLNGTQTSGLINTPTQGVGSTQAEDNTYIPYGI
jgi:hypothetical protein